MPTVETSQRLGRLTKPPKLTPEASVVWDRLVKQVNRLGTAVAADSTAFAILCQLTADYEATPTPKLATLLRSYLGLFNMVPASRVRAAAKSKDAETPADPFADIR